MKAYNLAATYLKNDFEIPGAYEPSKAAKEHATRFHYNPNYVTHLKKLIYVVHE